MLNYYFHIEPDGSLQKVDEPENKNLPIVSVGKFCDCNVSTFADTAKGCILQITTPDSKELNSELFQIIDEINNLEKFIFTTNRQRIKLSYINIIRSEAPEAEMVPSTTLLRANQSRNDASDGYAIR